MSDEICWTGPVRTNSPGGVYWELAGRVLHADDSFLPAVVVRVTTRQEWPEGEVEEVRDAIRASINQLKENSP